MQNQSCSTCHYWRSNECRALPPVQNTSTVSPFGRWLRTEGADWCGRWKSSVEAKAKAESDAQKLVLEMSAARSSPGRPVAPPNWPLLAVMRNEFPAETPVEFGSVKTVVFQYMRMAVSKLHANLKELMGLGLVKKDEMGRYFAPADAVCTDPDIFVPALVMPSLDDEKRPGGRPPKAGYDDAMIHAIGKHPGLTLRQLPAAMVLAGAPITVKQAYDRVTRLVQAGKLHTESTTSGTKYFLGPKSSAAPSEPPMPATAADLEVS